MKMLKRGICAFFLMTVLVISCAGIASAAKANDLYTWKNEETQHYAVICDQARLLTEEEEEDLEEYLDRMTQYCSAIFLTSDEYHTSSNHEFSKAMLEKIGRAVGMTDGYRAVIFVVDMEKRQLVIYAGDETKKVITTAISNTITDNTYSYASRGDYYSTAKEVFTQLYQVLDGQAIAQPMKYITSALLALFGGLAIGLILVRSRTKRKEAGMRAILESLATSTFTPATSVKLLSEKKVIHVDRSSGGGGGGGFSGGGFSGGGGGGGGFSGGGSSGSHGF